MAAPKNNQFWKQRATHGRKRIFESAEALEEAANEYFEYTSNRKWSKTDWVGKDATPVTRDKETPFTLTGLCLFLHVNTNYFRQFKKDLNVEEKEIDKDFSLVITRIEEIIFTQKFEGASVGEFNANIIARDLGLTDKKDVTTDGTPIQDNNIQIEIIR